MISALVIGLIVFLLLGIVLGKAKLTLERKQFAEQTLLFKKQLAEVENEKRVFEVKAEGLKKVIDQQKDQIGALECKLEEASPVFPKTASKQASAAAGSLPVKAVASEPKKREYVRFGNVDCALTTGKGGSISWKACLREGLPSPASAALKGE
ncbi:MAG: hypothetical protein P4L87_17950 [Formivibrio sp.]|nr:hypothetical protein [Formivibrio sp.]